MPASKLSDQTDLALSASFDRSIRLWDLTIGACIHTVTHNPRLFPQHSSSLW